MTTNQWDNENNDHFTVVNHRHNKKKKVKIDHVPPPDETDSSPTTLTSSINTGNSTSSTNTSSIIANLAPTRNGFSTNTTNGIPSSNATIAPKEITNQARRYAETRYAFLPFIIKLEQNVVDNLVIKELSDFFFTKFKYKLNFAGHRIKNKNELLLFAGNRESFALLFDDEKWPNTIKSTKFDKIRSSHLPPQFSIVVRNVPIDYDMTSFINDMKVEYPDVVNAHRITNKNHQPTTFVRVDIKNIKSIDDLLSTKYIYLNSSRYSITEYLAPAKVLVCTKCFQIGHFRSTCKSVMEFCRICGVGKGETADSIALESSESCRIHGIM